MSSQGGPSSGRADGSWWDAVYEGPDDEVPDAPGADSGQGSVDDWFASASGMISGNASAPSDRRTGDPVDRRPSSRPAEGPPTLVDGPGPALAPVPPRRTPPQMPHLTPQFRPPSFTTAQDAPAARMTAPAPPEVPAVPAPAPAGPPSAPEATAPAEPSEQAAEPPLPPLPFRPPRIPPQNPSQLPPRASDPRPPDPRVAAPEPTAPDPRHPGPDPDQAPYQPPYPATEPDLGLDDPDVLDDPDYAEPRAVREARPEPADRAVRDLDDVRDANAEAAAAVTVPAPTESLPQVGAQPPAYEPEPTLLPAADPALLTGIVPDTALDGARYGTMTLRAVSVRGDAARHYGGARSDRLLTVRFGEGSEALLLVVMATPPDPGNPAPADEAVRQLAAAVGRSRTELLADLRVGAQERLRYGLQRLTARAAVRLQNAPTGVGTGDGGALHALIAPLDPTSRLRAGFGVGPGGLLLLGDDAWYDAYAGRRLVAQQQQPSGSGATLASGPPNPLDRFRFRVVVPEPGDVLLLCSDGLAQPLREEPAVSDFLADHWAHPHPPGTVDFLRHVQVRANGYAADRTAAAIWED